MYRTFRLSAGGAALLEAAFAPDTSFDSGLLSPGVVILGRNPASSLQCSSFIVSGAHILVLVVEVVLETIVVDLDEIRNTGMTGV